MDDERAKDVPPDQRDEGEYDSGALTGDVAETSGGTVEGALVARSGQCRAGARRRLIENRAAKQSWVVATRPR